MTDRLMEVEKELNLYKVLVGIFIGSFIPSALMRYKNLSSSAKLLWVRLAQYAGEDGKCFPSQKTLAEEIGVSEVQVSRLVRELKEKKFIKPLYPTGQDRLSHKTVRYTFLRHDCFFPEDSNYEASTRESSGGNDSILFKDDASKLKKSEE